MERIESEKRIVETMIKLYCKGQGHRHEEGTGMCPECSTLLEYAHMRLSRCKFGNAKTSCQKCPIHCYKPEMKEAIRKVMRYSGPRLLLHHPIAAIKHMLGM